MGRIQTGAVRSCGLALILLSYIASTSSRAEEPAGAAPGDHLKSALEKPITVDFDNIPLNDAIRWLTDKTQLAVTLDRKALEDAGVDVDEPVTLRAGPLKFRNVLRRLCTPLDVVAVPRGDMLLITSRDQARQLLETRVYDVRDLHDYDLNHRSRLDPTFRDNLRIDPKALASLIEYAVDSPSWGKAGGQGSIAPFGGTLVVSQTVDHHERIASFLDRLRQVVRQRKSKRAPAATEDAVTVLRRRLEQKTTVDFEQRPLQEALDELGKKHNVSFWLDLKSLDEAALTGQEPITVHRHTVALATVLREMLGQYGLTHVILDEEILVTTRTRQGRWSIRKSTTCTT